LKDPAKQKAQQDLATAIMSPEFQEVFNLNKGSIPVRLNMKMDKFDDCGKASSKDFVETAKSGALVPSIAIAGLLAAALGAAVSRGRIAAAAELAPLQPEGAKAAFEVQPFSAEFLADYWLHFELTSVLLLAAVVAAIAVVKTGRRHDG